MICDACYNLEGQECHTPDCIFYLRSMKEVEEALDLMLIRPIVDGKSIKAQEGAPIGEGHRLQAQLTTLQALVLELLRLENGAVESGLPTYDAWIGAVQRQREALRKAVGE